MDFKLHTTNFGLLINIISMTQQWYMENGYALVNSWERQILEIYHDNKIIHEIELVTSVGGGSTPRIKADPSIRNFYEYCYPICLTHKRNLLISNVINDSDIGYSE